MNRQDIQHKTFSVVAESLPHLKRGAYKDFIDILKSDDVYDIASHNMTDHKYTMNTNMIEFFGMEDHTRATGAGRDFLFINEANNIPFPLYQQLQMRTRIMTFIDYNPTQSFWCDQSILGKPGVGYIHSTYKDNPYVSQNTIDLLNSMKDVDPNFYNVYALGLMGSLEGLVFQNFSIENFELNDKRIYSSDFGYTNDPTALLSVHMKDRTLYVDELLYKQGLTNPDISNHFLQLGLRKHSDIIYCDSAEPKSIEELYRLGWNAKPSIKGPDSVINSINSVKSFNLVVTPRSLNLIKELRNYQWMKDKDGKMINKPVGLDHAISALRYAVSSHFRIEKRSSTFTMI
jgi:phage terminase large subunit